MDKVISAFTKQELEEEKTGQFASKDENDDDDDDGNGKTWKTFTIVMKLNRFIRQDCYNRHVLMTNMDDFVKKMSKLRKKTSLYL